jgi:cobalamin-dependent methionine synthase I
MLKNYINKSLNKELERKYKTMDEKLKEVSNIQIDKPDNIENLYPCVINKTDIVLYTHEISLFIKGLK